MAKTVEFGQVLRSKSGKEYIKITDNPKVVVTIDGKKVNGEAIFFNDPKEKFRIFAEQGYMTEQEAEEAAERVPDFVLESLTLKLE